MRSTDVSVLARFATRRGVPLRDCIGLACAFAAQGLFRSSLGPVSAVPAHSQFIDPSSVGSMLSGVLGLLVVVVLSRDRRRLHFGGSVVAVALLAVTVGNVLLLLRPGAVAIPASLEAGAGGALVFGGGLVLIVAWVDRLSRLKVSAVLECYGIAILLSSAIKLMTLSLVTVAAAVVIVSIPFVSGILLRSPPTSIPEVDLVPEDAAPELPAALPTGVRNPWSRPLWSWCMTLALFGIAQGTIQGAGTRSLVQATPFMSLAARFAINGGQALGALVILSGLALWSTDRSRLIEQMALPFVIIALYLSTFLTGGSSLVYVLMNATSVSLIGALVWFAMTADDLRLSHSVVYIYAAASLWFSGLSATMVFVGVAMPRTLLLETLRVAIVSVALFALLLRREWSLPGASKPAIGEPDPTQAFDADQASEHEVTSARCESLAAHCHLTNRERDVLKLLARGRDAAHIASLYTIGPATVKTHIHSIYQKASVHSQQDLMDLVERHDPGLARAAAGQDQHCA